MCDRMKRIIGMDKPLLMGAQSSGYPEPLRYHDRDLEDLEADALKDGALPQKY
jgi:chemotaxis receptor (MCP) glutamine deamidase CheD